MNPTENFLYQKPPDPRARIDRCQEFEGERLTLRGLIKNRTSQEGLREIIRKYQDSLVNVRVLQRDMDRAEVANWASGKNGGNTLAAANDESTGKYDTKEKIIAPLMQNVIKAYTAYQAKTVLNLLMHLISLTCSLLLKRAINVD